MSAPRSLEERRAAHAHARPPREAPRTGSGGIGARLFIGLQHLLPHHGISRAVLIATRLRTPWLKNLMIRGFLKLFAVDMRDAVEPDPYRHGSFNEFFTRALRADARPIAAGASDIACPVDGRVSECGGVEADSLLQAKGRRYGLIELLAAQDWAPRFSGGSFATIYLAPFDYHRIHMPVSGRLLDTVYVPGRLFSVNEATAQRVPRLFARNERVLTLFEGAFGQFAVILVGALNVGSMSTVWAGDITPRARRAVTHLPASAVELEKGAELGRFNMGSTVIVLFQAGRARWRPELGAGMRVRCGESLGTLA
ncbi:MAG TPA: archaetidylserine decarboxylase [Steroidobacteraceae bacterium]|nr:archaetidylserine decarboxylase [Steroidobacteraceae bacterium]